MRVQEMKVVTIVLKNGTTKTIFFETEKEALEAYHKYKGNNLIAKLALNYTNTFKKQNSR